MELVPFNVSTVRRLNRNAVLEIVKERGPITRAGVARSLSMSRSAVSACIDDLLSEGIVREGEIGNSTSRGGRRSVMLEFVPTAKYALGIDIGGTKTMFLLTDLNGNIISSKKIPTKYQGVKSLQYIGDQARQFLNETNVEKRKLVGTGIGVPAHTDYENGFIVSCPALQISNLSIRDIYKDILPNPIYVDNDVNMAVLGEKWKGDGRGYRDIMLIAIGTGLGAGIILNEQVHRGANGFAGEIGYFHVDPLIDGFVPNPSEFGPIEAFATGTGIRNQATSLLPQFPNSRLNETVVTSENVFQAASEGDELATIVIERSIKYLSFAIANSVMLLNPDIVLIGGGVAQAGDSFIQNVESRVRQLISVPIKIGRARLEEHAGALGAAVAVLLETNNWGIAK